MANTVKFRAIISSLLLISFLIVFITGIGLYLAPSGKIAKEIAWSFLGLDKWQLENIHTVSAFLMSGLIFIHLFLNYKIFLNELKMLFKK